MLESCNQEKYGALEPPEYGGRGRHWVGAGARTGLGRGRAGGRGRQRVALALELPEYGGAVGAFRRPPGRAASARGRPPSALLRAGCERSAPKQPAGPAHLHPLCPPDLSRVTAPQAFFLGEPPAPAPCLPPTSPCLLRAPPPLLRCPACLLRCPAPLSSPRPPVTTASRDPPPPGEYDLLTMSQDVAELYRRLPPGAAVAEFYYPGYAQ
jgi:hypothetical protein